MEIVAKKDFILSNFDTTLLLRAFAIFAIVSGHFGFIGLAGGAYFLISLSGYNFVKFTRPKLFNNSEEKLKILTKKYFRFIIKLIIPTFLYLLLLHSAFGEIHFYSLFLVSNFIGPEYAGGFSYWFLEVLIQIYLVFFLFIALPSSRKLIKNSPFTFFLCGTGICYLISLFFTSNFDTSSLLNRFPHLLMYLFFLGGLLATSDSVRKKAVSSFLVFVITLYPLIAEFDGRTVFLIVACLMTLWLPRVYIPSFIGWVIEKIALSSLFIYLSHFQARSLIGKLVDTPSPWMETVFALLVGIVIAESWKRRKTVLSKFFESKRSVVPPNA